MATPVIDFFGVVTDIDGAPIAGAEVVLQRGRESSETARTTSDGKFSFTEVRGAPVQLRVRCIGYREYSRSFLAASVSTGKPVSIILERAPLILDTVHVAAIEGGRMREFYERRKIHRSGHFVERKEIDRRNPVYTTDMLRRFPGIAIRPSVRGGNSIRIRGCRPTLWIDGVQAVNAELDELTRPGEIEGVEVYGSSAGIPPQYRDRAGRSCGAVLVWTRIR
ncbi:MAG TPA: carboxypeptidase regulatory-like domain-containing protein [Gemmatimonadaceae bacterium]|nr:carboxypeptidase regulatory-like domain-containing protein [Gemmatimonadaceae bacterium]